MMVELIGIILVLYIGSWIGTQISISFGVTNCERPKGLWNLVPFRTSGWRSPLSGKFYKINWIFDDIDFSTPANNNKDGE